MYMGKVGRISCQIKIIFQVCAYLILKFSSVLYHLTITMRLYLSVDAFFVHKKSYTKKMQYLHQFCYASVAVGIFFVFFVKTKILSLLQDILGLELNPL